MLNSLTWLSRCSHHFFSCGFSLKDFLWFNLYDSDISCWYEYSCQYVVVTILCYVSLFAHTGCKWSYISLSQFLLELGFFLLYMCSLVCFPIHDCKSYCWFLCLVEACLTLAITTMSFLSAVIKKYTSV